MGTIFDTGYKTYRNLLSERLLLKECRLKNLRDICLEYIGKNLHCITRASQYLAPLHKELIIERLAFHDLFSPEYLHHVTYNLFSPRLTRINFYKCDQINEMTLKLLASSGCLLHQLTIHKCGQVTDNGVLAITKDQTKLRILELRKLKITKRGVTNICSPCLEAVDFRGCNMLVSAAIQTVVTANPTIKYLNLVDCQKVTEEVFQHIARNLGANLEFLDLAEMHCFQDESLIAIATHCPNLARMNLLGCNKLTDASLTKLFNNCPKLESLDLSYCSRLIQNTPSARQVMLNLPNTVQELALNGLQLTDSSLLAEGVGALKKLVKLKLCGVPALDDSSLEQIMQQLGGTLEYFDICGSVMSQLTDDGLRSIATYCQQLSVLGLSLLKNVTGKTLVPLLSDHRRAPKLTRVLMCIRQLDESVLDAVTENCFNLEHLDISGLSIVTDQTLETLAENCSNLSDINIKACRNVTDSGVAALAVRCPLCVVVLSGLHQLTDRSILVLANACPYLEELYISGCDNVSPSAVTYLKDVCIPRVTVIHRVPNARNTAKNLDTGNYDTY